MSDNADGASKYANLPGIAIGQADVFETSDLPEADQRNYRPSALLGDVDHGDSVEVINVAPTEAFKKFDGHRIDGDLVDFRNLSSRGGRGYQSFGEWEISGQPVSNENETLLQKYNRVQAEMNELLGSFSTIKEQATKKDAPATDSLTGDLTLGKAASHLEELAGQMNELNIAQWIENDILKGSQRTIESLTTIVSSTTEKSASDASSRPEKSTPVVTYELHCRSDQGRGADLARINLLDQKIKGLENLVGDSDQKLSFLTNMTNDKTMSEAVRVLSTKVSQLDAGHLEQIDGRLTSILQKLHQISKTKSSEDIERQTKLDQVHELLVKSDQQRSALPVIVSRLNSLAAVQEQAAQFAGALSYMDSVQTQISESLKHNEADLRLVKETFDQNVNYLKQTLAEYDKRIQALN